MNKSRGHLGAGSGQQQLRGDLDRLAGDARGFLLRARMGEEFRAACGSALFGLFVFPLVLLLVQLTQGLLGAAPQTVSLWTVAGLALLGPVLYVLARVGSVYYRYHPRRQSALALYDKELRTHDRLVIADEFLVEETAGVTPRDHSEGFRQAAVMDAESYARSALNAALTPKDGGELRIRPMSWLGVPAAAAVAALLFIGIGGQIADAKADEKALLAALDATLGPNASEEERAAARKNLRRLQEQKKEMQVAAMEQQAGMQNKPQKSRNEKGAEGQSNTGNAAMAQSSNTSNSAAGDPSNQKNASKPKKPEEQKPEEEDAKDAKNKQPKKPEQQKTTQVAMESTSGQGKTSMSKSSPTQFDMPEEEDRAGAGVKQDGKDEDAEDEDEQEKSNGVSKPSLKDKKAPVERNMCPKPSGQCKDPNKNGRGGPGSLKKTRGVPAMILGVPIADRVQGMSHPGRSKVTQEDAKPKEESQASVEAEARLARNDAMGRVEHPGLRPWMQDLVKEYFMSLRQGNSEKTVGLSQ